MDMETAIRERVSCPRLDGPAPTADELEQLLAAAIRAPDHGLLRPWRFIVIQGEERVRFGEMLAQCCREDQPDLSEAQCEKLRQAPLRAPMMLIVLAEVTTGHRVSVIDQIMACAAAVQNLLLCAHSIGVGAMWRTGAPALSPSLKTRLGFCAEDEIVGFVYLGTPCGNGKEPSVDTPASYMRTLPDA
ncbi:nitroreductase [Alcanivorax sp. 1008]|uniref:nitroreductase family protein n=1 Tax=Alcanivorax sp. 1008 TaxID=2816853 RepID=UPI001D46E9B5|nr:nitroreductase [Alcanivorax sp. 1008]MCC1496343.1 nitroreductase [Alcanivorax sp. 1008]